MNIRLLLILSVMSILFYGCKKKDTQHQQVVTNNPPPLTDTTPVMGYNLFSKICGIWDGGVTSTTAIGGFPEWIVDFRPMSGGQVGAKNELDTANSIFMSFFITYHNSAYKLAFRNGGTFAIQKRSAYMEIDSVVETSSQSYYRFVDFVKGPRRTITEVIFKQDSLTIRSYTNKYNTLPAPVLHMEWTAKLQDTSSCKPAIANFNFPQKTLVKDFSTTFAADSESIFYQLTGDPYPETAQPYVGHATLSYTVLSGITFSPNKNVLMVVTTQPLISGLTFNAANLIYRSRYVILASTDNSFVFNYMHPGTYYLYAIYDADGDGTVSPGDYVSTANTTFTLPATGTVSQTTQINFQVP